MRAACTRTITSATVAEPTNGLPSRPAISPITTWTEIERNTHQSHEFRLSTPDDWRLRGIVGAFWEQLQIQDQLNWNYKTSAALYRDRHGRMSDERGTCAGCSVNNPAPIRGDNTAFFNDVQRGYRQTAFFTSLGL